MNFKKVEYALLSVSVRYNNRWGVFVVHFCVKIVSLLVRRTAVLNGCHCLVTAV
jgi:hypothetical protein